MTSISTRTSLRKNRIQIAWRSHEHQIMRPGYHPCSDALAAHDETHDSHDDRMTAENRPMRWCEPCKRWVQNLLHEDELRFASVHGAAQ